LEKVVEFGATEPRARVTKAPRAAQRGASIAGTVATRNEQLGREGVYLYATAWWSTADLVASGMHCRITSKQGCGEGSGRRREGR
jgi:hypothetical protein